LELRRRELLEPHGARRRAVAQREHRLGAADVAREDHAGTCAAAAVSTNHTAFAPISCDGYLWMSRGPRSTAASGSALSAPATRKRMLRPALSAFAVSVIRVVGPFVSGEFTAFATTQSLALSSAGEPGNSEAVWPSGPIPSIT